MRLNYDYYYCACTSYACRLIVLYADTHLCSDIQQLLIRTTALRACNHELVYASTAGAADAHMYVVDKLQPGAVIATKMCMLYHAPHTADVSLDDIRVISICTCTLSWQARVVCCIQTLMGHCECA